MLTLISPQKQAENEILELIQNKLLKNFGRDDMMKCIPVLWTELNRLKSRVESILNSLSNKTVQNEKVIEFKKQLVSNKSLKAYFSEHQEEKEILLNDIDKV